MKYFYPLNQPMFAMMSSKYSKYYLRQNGIISSYQFQIDLLSKPQEITIFPDGVEDMVFVCKNTGEKRVYCYGTPLQTGSMNPGFLVENGDILFGTQMMPDVMKVMAGLSADDIIASVVDLSSQKKMQQMAEQIFTYKTFPEQAACFLKIYINEYQEKYNKACEHSRLSLYMLNRMIQSQGTVKMNTLSEEALYTTRYMNKVFRQEYGIGPKYFERIIRFQVILNKLMSDCRLIDISEDLGFSEANLVREFKKIAGVTPNAYRKILKEYRKHISLYYEKERR